MMTQFAIGLPGGPEVLIIIAVILLLIFGSRIPQLARNLGRSFVEFKAGLKSGEKKDDDEKKSTD